MLTDIQTIQTDDNWDAAADEKMKQCLRERKNFIMFAGAGSGKTRSLVSALDYIEDNWGTSLSLRQQQVAIITYTNAAAEEIRRRKKYNSVFVISTIHSFLWALIKPFQRDIKTFVINREKKKRNELQEKHQKAKKDYSDEIFACSDRLEMLNRITRFTYNPNGVNVGRDSLDHAEVVSMGTEFIKKSSVMQSILVSRYPILLIDESQDTKKDLVEALLELIPDLTPGSLIGLFGDSMQRIYADGKPNLDSSVPETWTRIQKKMNHRSPERIVRLANSIREPIDTIVQRPRQDRGQGYVRLFVVPSTENRKDAERVVLKEMAKITNDFDWLQSDKRKVLVLEHSMAAERLGFSNLDDALRKCAGQNYKDGSIPELAFLMNVIKPLKEASAQKDAFGMMKILREYSIQLKHSNLEQEKDQLGALKDLKASIEKLVSLWDHENDPTCITVYRLLSELKIFELPKAISEILGESETQEKMIIALREGLRVPFSMVEEYWKYVNDLTEYSTHQGIKGLEFPRVAVIMDDQKAGGFLFSYEKLFGAKPLSDTDKKNAEEGNETTPDRTKRLLYVTCTRAMQSLVLIAFTTNVNTVEKNAIENRWFEPNEVICL